MKPVGEGKQAMSAGGLSKARLGRMADVMARCVEDGIPLLSFSISCSPSASKEREACRRACRS
jgi:hypothetical protein